MSRPPAPPPAPPPNSRFGPFTLSDRIAVGGMAEVFRAEEPRSAGEPRTIVIKRMLPSLQGEPLARAMFEEEARIGKLIESEHVVRVLGYGVEGKAPYIALEHVPGVDLFRLVRWLTRAGRMLPTELAVHIVRQLLQGLSAVHHATDRQGAPLDLVHCDVSPSNVLLSVHGDVKLADFGIARARSRSGPMASVSGRAKGKLGYLSPEQVRGLAPSVPTDLFAAGVIAAELLMGRPLFSGGSELAVLLAIRDAQIKPFTDHSRNLPLHLGAVVARALERDPAQRMQSADEFAEALARFENTRESDLRRAIAGLVTEAYLSRAANPSQTLARVPADIADSETREHTPQTGRAPELDYWVESSDGQSVGPLTYAKLVEAVALGRFGVTDSVAERGMPFRPLAEHADLARHLPASSLTERTAPHRTAEAHRPEQEWSLENGAIVPVFGELVLRRETGLLLCEQGGVRKEVYLSEGVPEFVTSNLANELLGEFLVQRNVITRGELDMALAVMPRFEGRLGDTLSSLGLVEPVPLFRQIAAQVTEKLLELFGWTTGRATFWRGVPRPPSGFPLRIDAFRVLLDGIDRRIEQNREDPFLALTGTLVRAEPGPRGLDRDRLPIHVRRGLELAARPIATEELRKRLAETRSNDPRAGHREIAMLRALGALIEAD